MSYPIALADASNMHAVLAAVGEPNLRFTRWEQIGPQRSAPRTPRSQAWLSPINEPRNLLFVYSIAEVTRSNLLLRATYFVNGDAATLERPPFVLDPMHTRYLRIDACSLYNNITGAIDSPVWSAYVNTGDGFDKIQFVS